MINKRSYILIVLELITAIRLSAQDDRLAQLHSLQDSAKHYEALNKNLQAYNFAKKAYSLMFSIPGFSQDKVARTESDLGTYAYRMGNISLSETHHRNAIKIIRSMPAPNYESLYLSGNNMGSIMWFASKMDSAQYYFNIAIEALSKMEATPMNKYYRPAVLYNNLAGVYGVQGKTTEGIDAMKKTIRNLALFLDTKDSSLRKDNALHFQFEATDNLAGIYKELGDYSQAYNLLTHSYHQKQKTFNNDDPDIYKSEVLIGQLHYAMKDYLKAEDFLLKGLKGFENADGDFLFWQADAYSTLALVYEDTHKPQTAARNYELADSLYEKSLDGEYDNIYLQFLNNAAVFYAKNNSANVAINKAIKGYKYIVAAEGEHSLPGFYQLLNLADVYFELNNYKESLKYSRKALNVVNDLVSSSGKILDSIKIELKKPKAILLTSRCEYELLDKKTPGALASILDKLRGSLDILERRRSVLQDANDVNLLISDHRELLDFIKKITFELYSVTNDARYIDELTSFHESGLYNRVRSRLDQDNSIKFADVPANVQNAERQLRASLVTSMESNEEHNNKMWQYIKTEEHWKLFLDTLKIKYPAYYKMRYSSIFKSLKEIMNEIPGDRTITRFIFIGKDLLALVADKEQKHLVTINTEGLTEEIDSLFKHTMNAEKTGEILYKLYNRLWQPVAKYIRHKRVVIIPDGILFNINFEMLSPVKIRHFDELATNSILAKYIISYNYSLFLLDREKNNSLKNNFVAFTPGFFDNIKNEYKRVSDTSITIDNIYMSLLPQPFTVDLAKKIAKDLGGNIFTGNKSTVNSFRENANGHKIIHIGTHAHADNLHPQFSRLIFSKDISNDSIDNNLYLFDIYNCHLNSNLAVLTACESGKVGYEDGEGLISLAHAFNYAGSESILMGLWKIDEQSCATLAEEFYDNLSKGMAKDEALRNAKLAYLRKTTGRALAPQYWAGLVIMGDISPIQVERQYYYPWIIAGMIMLLGFVILLSYKLKKNGRS